jgi:uncharacterized membrane protein
MAKKMLRYSHRLVFIFFIVFLCIPLFDLLHSGLPVTHDGQDHVARIANFYQNLTDGVFIPRWGGNLNWGYGHPVLMFLYPLPSYFASVFSFFSFSFVDSLKIVFALSFVASGYTMYLWIREESGKLAGIVSGLLYTIAPYRFVDLFVRGAIGEHVAFIFPPLVLYFSLKLFRTDEKRYFWYAAFAFAALILSHNAISLMFIPLIMLYILYLVGQMKYKRRYLFSLLGIPLLGFGLSAFFWLPALLEGKYTLRDIVTAGDYSSRFVPWQDFFYGSWSYGGTQLLSKQIGIAQWFVIICGFISLFVIKRQKSKKPFLGVLLAIFFFSLFIMTSSSAFVWHHVSLLAKFQFPWRFLSLSVFTAAAIGGILWAYLPLKRQIVLLGLLVLVLIITTDSYWHANTYLERSQQFYSSVYNGTTDTGESSPIWSVRFMEKRPVRHMELIDGDATIIERTRTSTAHIYTITAKGRSLIKENTIYFPGWHIFVDGTEVHVEFQDQHYRGIMTFFIEQGIHTVEVRFIDTKLRTIANFISLGCLCILIGWLILKSTIWRRFR